MEVYEKVFTEMGIHKIYFKRIQEVTLNHVLFMNFYLS